MSLDYLLDAAHWSGPDGFPHQILEHLRYTGLALLIAMVIALPLGVLIGHTGRGAGLAINLGNAGRALPTLGVLMLILAVTGVGLKPVIGALVVLAIPPLLTATYAGVSSVDRGVVDAARGVGLREPQIALGVEVPLALPVILGGVRSATLQVISTATIAAYVAQDGLGRYLFDGLAVRDYPRIVAGAVVLAVLAVVVDALLALLQRVVVSPGVRPRAGSRRRTALPQPER
ncbi:ABC transporter permease [Nocardioides sp. TRM66260-LWL]|uniref:ABC transporter permease n=1 Tax=Nocardioides sp. TRM66260-LWL TaxID=2874478 RepID=UPI001CC7F2AB|nr:ABC transporter permease [Nocardioides sp. TRM66260-LWL]MBZ5735757.1 ABC transporter permease [Nocardioides sp. TRM66260-LWL]